MSQLVRALKEERDRGSRITVIKKLNMLKEMELIEEIEWREEV